MSNLELTPYDLRDLKDLKRIDEIREKGFLDADDEIDLSRMAVNGFSELVIQEAGATLDRFTGRQKSSLLE